MHASHHITTAVANLPRKRLIYLFSLLPIPTRIPPRPIPRNLLVPLPIVLVLLRDAALDRVVRHRLREQLPRELEHGRDPRGWLPLVGLQHAETHAALVVVGHVGVVDLGREGDGGGFEGVGAGEGEVDEECAALEETDNMVS